MAILLQLPTRRRPTGPQPVPPRGTADILLFTGIRYDRPPAPPGREQSPPDPDPLGRRARPS